MVRRLFGAFLLCFGYFGFLIFTFAGTIPLDSREPSVRVLDELAERARFTWRDSYGVGDLADAMEQEEKKVEISGSPQRNRFNVNLDNILHWAVRTYDISGNGELIVGPK